MSVCANDGTSHSTASLQHLLWWPFRNRVAGKVLCQSTCDRSTHSYKLLATSVNPSNEVPPLCIPWMHLCLPARPPACSWLGILTAFKRCAPSGGHWFKPDDHWSELVRLCKLLLIVCHRCNQLHRVSERSNCDACERCRRRLFFNCIIAMCVERRRL